MDNHLPAVADNPDAPADPTKWMPRCATLALDDPPSICGPWDAKDAKRQLVAAKIDPPALLRAAIGRLAPTASDWLAKRLSLLWGSMPTSGNMTAKAWLHETGRMLKHLPQDILAHAIDEAARQGSGFVPGAAQILDIAEPMHRKRKLHRARLDEIVNGKPATPVRPWEQRDIAMPADGVCTPEEARDIMRRDGIPLGESEQRRERGPLRMPTIQDYIDMGVARDDAERAVAGFRPQPR